MSTKVRKERESTLKAALMDRLRKYTGVLAFRIEDTATAGIPDMSVDAGGFHTWWEVKYGNPSFDWGGLQHKRMMELEAFGYARYIIYRETENRSIKHVYIVKPSEMENQEKWDQVSCSGFHHDWVVEFILAVHRAMKR
jgi:hypothetical protein